MNSWSGSVFGLDVETESSDRLVLKLFGSWRTRPGLPSTDRVETELSHSPAVQRLAFETSGLSDWDSALISFLMSLREMSDERGLAMNAEGLPAGARRLFELATAVPETKATGHGQGAPTFLTGLGAQTLTWLKDAGEMLGFIGEATLMFGRFLTGRANYRRTDLVQALRDCGAQALPIITIISVLVGLILAFVGAVQLEQFGAGIYVADLVGIAMAREMGAIMTGIVMAGRTGAAFAAQIGTMQGNEEIDALTTLGISSMDFLVLPRMLALMLMMPLLCVYADVAGIFGGWLVGVGMLDLTSTAYLLETQENVGLTHFALGLVKSVVFGVIVAVTGCLSGLRAERNAAAVGNAATAAVVSGIIYIIIADAIFAVVANMIGI